jgi:octaprenyl-diphosphate synthase
LRAVQTILGPKEAPQGAVAELSALVAPDMARVNALILQWMQSPVPLIPELAGHLIQSGGKRLRPMLTLGAAQLAGYQGDAHVKLAAAVEFIHTATLLHDDVVDESALRRGQKTANVIWGNQASVLVGDFLYSRSFQLMVETGDIRVLKTLADASSVIAQGEVMQLAATQNLATSEAIYLDIVAAKTAALFAAAAEVSGVVSGRGPSVEGALRDYGHHLGVAFQLVDDALDYSGREAMMGKSVGDDFREGKITLPVILAVQRGGAEDAEFWRRTIEARKQTPEDLQTAIRLIEKHKAIPETIARAQSYADAATASLGIFPDSAMKSALVDLAAFCVARAY